MATKRIIQLPQWLGIGQGNTGTIDLPIGPRYHTVWLEVTAAAKTLTQILSELRIKINGKVQRVHTATELDALNTFLGAIYASQNAGGAGNSYRLPIFLAEPWRIMQSIREGMAWSTGGVGSFQIETDFNATAGAAITATAWAEVDNSIMTKDGQPQPLGYISKWYRTQLPVNGLLANILSLPKTAGAYQQISLFDANISRVEVKVDNVVIRNITKTINDASLVKAGMTPVAGRFDLVFDHDDILGSALPMEYGNQRVQDFQLNLTLSDGTARNIPCIYQTIALAD